MIDTKEGKILSQEELEKEIIGTKPFGEWLAKNKRSIEDIASAEPRYETNFNTIFDRLMTFGYTREDLYEVIAPMAKNSKEAIGSMGNDAALAVLSDKEKLLFNYFQQLFAQVTNPPIDPIREEIVMSLTTNIGVKGNILDDKEDKAKVIKLDSPIITNEELDKVVNLKEEGFKTKVLPITFELEEGLEKGLEKLFKKAEAAVEEGCNILVLSDREISGKDAPIPSLLATAGLHHHLIKARKRNGVDLIVETGEAREVMHFALLIGYGALAINPYLALEAINYMAENEIYLTSTCEKKKEAKYIKAVGKGLLKIMSKMGISTVQSYRGAQIFEAVGLSTEFVNKYFVGTPSRIEVLFWIGSASK
jgi:hypothetical protein